MHPDKELQKFLDETPGYEPDLKWVDRVNKSKKDIREFLGGKNKVIQIEMDDVYLGLPEHETEIIYNFFANNMIEYLQQYNISQAEFENPFIVRSKKSKKTGSTNNKKISWGKHIKFWCDKNEVYPRGLENIMSNMGELYAMYKNKKMNLTFTVTTEPMIYASLGSLGEYRSCFRQGSENPHHKYILGQSPGSFVILVTHDPIKDLNYKTINETDFLGRLWGFRNKDTDSFVFCNWYPKKCKIMNCFLSGLEKGIKKWLGDQYTLKSDNKYFPTISTIWHNNRGNSNQEINWCAFNKDTTKNITQVWDTNAGNMARKNQVQCRVCGRKHHIDSTHIDEYSGKNVCYSCYSKPAKKSDFSGKESRTASLLYYIDEKGKIKQAFPNEIERLSSHGGVGIIKSIDGKKIVFDKFGKSVYGLQKPKRVRVIFKDASYTFICMKEVEIKEDEIYVSRYTDEIDESGTLTIE